MKISRKSALKTIGAAFGSTILLNIGSFNEKVGRSTSSNDDYNVRDYGAIGDGKLDDTEAINRAINSANKAGGGRVVFPSGRYVSGSVRMKSNITLYLHQGAVLEASDNPCVYDNPEPFEIDQYQDFGHSHWHNSLIWGENLCNIGITGPGMIYGKGLLREKSENQPEEEQGNKVLALKKCNNIMLKDFTIKHGGWFCILATGVNNLTVDNLTIDTSRDGINIDSCRSVRISNCNINCPFDDAICLKSSYALGQILATQHVTISNCTISGYKEGTLLDGSFEQRKENGKPVRGHGRIKFGTESNGGFKNISISNCTFENCRGLALETVDGGLLEDISISNLTMRNIKNAPIFLRLGRRMRGPVGIPVGSLQRINISNIVGYRVDSRAGIFISGLPNHSIMDVKLSNIQIEYDGGGTPDMAAINPPELAQGYPDPKNFGELPAYGMYLRHVDGIEITNAKFSYIDRDVRPAFVLDDVTSADFRFIKTKLETGIPTFSIRASKDVKLLGCNFLADQTLGEVDRKDI